MSHAFGGAAVSPQTTDADLQFEVEECYCIPTLRCNACQAKLQAELKAEIAGADAHGMMEAMKQSMERAEAAAQEAFDVAEAVRQSEEEERLRSAAIVRTNAMAAEALKQSWEAAEAERLRVEAEVQCGFELMQAKQKADAEQAMAWAKFRDAEQAEKARCDLQKLRDAEEAEVARCKALEVAQLKAQTELALAELQKMRNAKAEEEAASLQARTQLKAVEEELRKANQQAAVEESAREQKAKQERCQAELAAALLKEQTELKVAEEAKRKAEAEETEARRRAQIEEEARRKEAADKDKTWLQRGMDAADEARQLEIQGEQQQALDTYKKCVAMYTMAQKGQETERVRGAIGQMMAEFAARIVHLQDAIWAAGAAGAAEALSENVQPSKHGYLAEYAADNVIVVPSSYYLRCETGTAAGLCSAPACGPDTCNATSCSTQQTFEERWAALRQPGTAPGSSTNSEAVAGTLPALAAGPDTSGPDSQSVEDRLAALLRPAAQAQAA